MFLFGVRLCVSKLPKVVIYVFPPNLICDFFRLAGGGDTRSSESLEDDQPELAQQSTTQLIEQAEPQIDQQTPKVEDEAPKDESISTSAPAPAPAPAEASTQQPQASTKWLPWCSCCPSCCWGTHFPLDLPLTFLALLEKSLSLSMYSQSSNWEDNSDQKIMWSQGIAAACYMFEII
jgi:hypothetical protein